MISSNDAKYILRESKSRAKQKEYKIDLDNYPQYRVDFRDLDYSAVYALSKYAESVQENKDDEMQEYYGDLKLVSQYFDAATNIVRDFDYSTDYLLLGACAYFLSDDFGSSMALLNQFVKKRVSNVPRLLTAIIMQTAFYRIDKSNFKFQDELADTFFSSFLTFLDTGTEIEMVYINWSRYRNVLYNESDEFGLYYINVLYAIIKQIEKNSTWKLLPLFSGIDVEKWTPYLVNKKSSKMLWSAQKIIGEAGIFAGKSGIIQLPTGVGKTKSLEFLIRSAFVGERTNAVIIITPLRALCSEVRNDMYKAFGKSVVLSQFSDALQEDFSFSISDNTKNIIVCTPEKLKYILHHKKDFLMEVGLFIFDEGHMFDSPKRGAAYELLVTTIKNEIDLHFNGKQCVFISAVMSNAIDISKWLFNGNGVIALSENIKTTEKNIGFVSLKENSIDYYTSEDFGNRNFWVQGVFKQSRLMTPAGKISKKTFPDNTAKDISLYLMNLLSPNGAVAIYILRPDWISGYIKRLIDTHKKRLNFDGMLARVNSNEQRRLRILFDTHYGINSIYSQGVDLGVVPHYADLEEGAKASVEYALREGLFGNVMCTSTLAQGVNIPIRYLLITAFDGYQRDMKARELLNLVGRTARSGMHSEGSVIITDMKLYAERNIMRGYQFKSGGRYEWDKKTALFNPQNSEPCDSSIRAIIEPFFIHKDYNQYCIKDKILASIESGDVGFKKLRQSELESCNEISLEYGKHDTIVSNILRYINSVKYTVEAIESHLSFLISTDITDNNSIELMTDRLCESTLAYALSDEEDKAFLIKLFRAIAENVVKIMDKINPVFQSKAMTGIQNSLAITKWLADNAANLDDKDAKGLAELILPLFIELSENNTYTEKAILEILLLWIDGKPLCNMYNWVNDILPNRQNIIDLEKFCRKNISYTFSFLVGNIMDLSEDISEGVIEQLQVFQKRLKYGLKTVSEISLYEEGLIDRFIVGRICDELDLQDDIEKNQIVNILKTNKAKIKEILKEYPSYFEQELERICNK